MELNTPLNTLPGIGAAREAALGKLGLHTVADLLSHFPRDYEDRHLYPNIAALPQDVPVCFQAMVAEPFHSSYIRKGMTVTRGRVVDDTGQVDLTFFNLPYAKKVLEEGRSFVFYGVVTGGGRRAMAHPQFQRAEDYDAGDPIQPVYPLSAGVSNQRLLELMRQAMDCIPQIQETLEEDIRRRYDLAPVALAYRGVHFPKTWEELEVARRRLRFEELFCLNLGLALIRTRREEQPAAPFVRQDLGPFLENLPFSLTAAQLRCVQEAAGDLKRPVPMNRLLQGDVGSGKTVVAAACAVLAWENGCQAALMAPTELLAQQHHRTLSELLSGTGMRVGLLTGSMTAAEKKKARAALAEGEIDFVVGTHALISEGVAFRRLALIVADEQHRFGVAQRAALAAKSGEDTAPHVLVMSATPIPRTLALIIYGDLDVSIMDELPPGRTPVSTFTVGEDKRQRMYGFVRKQVGEGRQVYIVCPSVEENSGGWEDGPGMDLKAVTAYARQLQEQVFPDLRVGFVHGKLKSKDKEAVMAAFAGGTLDVLVSTTVIEVGVDVPNASLMIIENADRFGLSQLHQLRGRVGRGKHQSWCVLVSSSRGETARERLKALCATTDGFQIAEEDLRLRGPGDFFGKRQHGLPQLKVADFAADLELLKEARAAAEELIAADPELKKPSHRLLKRRVRELFEENAELFN